MSANIYEITLKNKNCIHEVVCPIDVDFKGIKTEYEPAKKYKFKLDVFQERSVLAIENNHSVLVSAHTSAGKTVVAEYAVAKALKNGQRCIYTTPIKALSNQKFTEFEKEFKDVGLITGDVTINPSASCLIMTTEILRQMLMRGHEIMREVGWVIYDEIHYMRDKERGVVWEESIILLPEKVHSVFLSATIPNARQFAEWICFLHHETCHVVYTDHRPVPLEHHIYAGGLIYKVVDSEGKLLEDKFQTALSQVEAANPKTDGSAQKKQRRYIDNKDATASNLERVIRAAKGKCLVPIIIFSFSKKECEIYATRLKDENFNDEEEKANVDHIFTQAVSILSDDDKKLAEGFKPLLQNGVGIHHGGLLPIIKEVTELMFAVGLIKALFATETFAMGLNMPAKTVVFSNVRKFDGKDFRYITSGEYIQMSGRAGRRGLDDRGIVIMMVDENITSAVGKNLLLGKPDCLNSAFHLTYNMVLNLIRVEGIEPEFMLKQSFYNFQTLTQEPKEGEERLTESVRMTELKNMKKVLRRLNYCSQDDVIEIKGRVACHITTGDELLLTEMLFNGAFNDLSSHQAAALLSCFVFDEKCEQSPKLIEELDAPLKTMQNLAKTIVEAFNKEDLAVDEKEYIDKFKPFLMDAVYAWSQGRPFTEICKMTDAYVGSIIRCLRRLEELLRQMCEASRVIGNVDLETKFAEAITQIKRDIVFAPSLYL